MLQPVESKPVVTHIKYATEARPSRQHVPHIGPWHRELLVSITNPAHHRETHFCHGNCVTCPGHAAEALEAAQLRAEILTRGDVYLEEHCVTTEVACRKIARAVERAGGTRVVICLKENDFRLLCTVPVDGRTFTAPGQELEAGPERVDYVNELMARAPREHKHKPFRFAASWPRKEPAPKKFRVVGNSPDEATEAASAEEHAAITTGVLQRQQIPYHAIPQGSSVLHVDFFIPYEIISNPLRYNWLCSSLGYSSIDLRHFTETSKLARAHGRRAA